MHLDVIILYKQKEGNTLKFLQNSPIYCCLITPGTSLGQIYPDNPLGLSTVCTRILDVCDGIPVQELQTSPMSS